MKKVILAIGGLLISIQLVSFVYADTITLKSGTKITGKIIGQTAEYVKIDFRGSQLTYYLKDIAKIETDANLKQEKNFQKLVLEKDYDQIIAYAEQVLSLPYADYDSAYKIKILDILANSYLLKQNYQKALELFGELKDNYLSFIGSADISQDDKYALVKEAVGVYTLIIYNNVVNGDIDVAKAALDECLEFSDRQLADKKIPEKAREAINIQLFDLKGKNIIEAWSRDKDKIKGTLLSGASFALKVASEVKRGDSLVDLWNLNEEHAVGIFRIIIQNYKIYFSDNSETPQIFSDFLDPITLENEKAAIDSQGNIESQGYEFIYHPNISANTVKVTARPIFPGFTARKYYVYENEILVEDSNKNGQVDADEEEENRIE